MLSRSIAALVMIVAAGCGDDGVVTVIPDAPFVHCQAQCNPVAPTGQQGCGAGERCAALVLAPHEITCPDALVIGCVPDGTQALGQGCIWGPPGPDTGHDNCMLGAVCASDARCRDICGFGGTPAEACAGGLTCFPYERFAPEGGGEPRFGVCATPP